MNETAHYEHASLVCCYMTDNMRIDVITGVDMNLNRQAYRTEGIMNLEKLGRVQDIMREMTDQGFVSGASCLIIQHGEEQCYYETGYRDIAAEHSMTRDTIHRLYSMTKPVTAAAVMILLEEGRIDLLDQVSDYLPGFRNQYVIEQGVIVPVKRPITIQSLLNMTSGLTYPGEGSPAEIRCDKLIEEVKDKLLTDQALTTIEIANRIGKLPLAFIPGTTWQYGLSADVLGAIVEVVSGMRFGDFLKQRIFEPLGMNDTDFYVPEDKQGRLAKVYQESEGRLVEETGCHLGIQNHRLAVREAALVDEHEVVLCKPHLEQLYELPLHRPAEHYFFLTPRAARATGEKVLEIDEASLYSVRKVCRPDEDCVACQNCSPCKPILSSYKIVTIC